MKRITALLTVGLAAGLIGCSSAPEQEEADARAALRNATEADAAVYAPQELSLAQGEFDRALEEKKRQDDRFRLLRSYGASRELFVSSRDLAEAALRAAGDNRNLRAAESQRVYDQAMRAIEACSDTLAGAPKGSGKGVKVDLAMFEDDIQLLATELEGVRPYLDIGQYDKADSLSLSVSRRATELQEEIVTAALKNRRR